MQALNIYISGNIIDCYLAGFSMINFEIRFFLIKDVSEISYILANFFNIRFLQSDPWFSVLTPYQYILFSGVHEGVRMGYKSKKYCVHVSNDTQAPSASYHSS